VIKDIVADMPASLARASWYSVASRRSAAILALGAALGAVMACPAYAAFGYSPYGGGWFFLAPAPAVREPAPVAPRKFRRPRTMQQGADKPGGKEQAAKPPKAPLIIAVSIGEQRVRVFEGSTPIAEAPVSTGMRGHPTPMGVFSVIQKHKWHRSNIYSGAPMPYMQRITWSGVALHAGVLPGYPASHGCIRMPNEFAVRLWGMTRMGARVIVSRHGVTPVEIENTRLALLKKQTDTVADPTKPQTNGALEGTGPADAAATYAQLRGTKTAEVSGLASDAPARVVTQAPKPFEAPAAEAKPAPAQASKPAETKEAEPASSAPDAAKAAADAAPAAADPAAPQAPAVTALPEKALRPGPVSIFISRREGKLFVRKGFEPVFDMPVTIANRDQPLGTHVFTATELKDDGQSLRWVALSMPPEARPEPRHEAPRVKPHGRREVKPALAAPPSQGPSAAEALERVELPKEALDRIAAMLSPGASLIVSDHGLGGETGKETDFIVLTR
jgi:hypothetical protein